MKKLSKIKLNQLSKNELELKKSEMHVLKGAGAASGGCTCVCLEPSFPSADHPYRTTNNSAI